MHLNRRRKKLKTDKGACPIQKLAQLLYFKKLDSTFYGLADSNNLDSSVNFSATEFVPPKVSLTEVLTEMP